MLCSSYALPLAAGCFLASTSLAFSAGDSAASSALAAAAAFATAALVVAALFFVASVSAAFLISWQFPTHLGRRPTASYRRADHTGALRSARVLTRRQA